MFGGEQSNVGAAVAGRDPKGLSFTGNDVGAVMARSLEHAHGCRVGGDHRQRALGVGGVDQFLQVLDVPEIIGVLQHDTSRLAVQCGAGWVDDFHRDVLRLAVGADHGGVCGRDAVGQRHFLPFGYPAGHQRGLGQAGRAVIHAGVGHLHAVEVADQGLELIDHLEGPLAGLGLVGRVGGNELAPGYQRFDYRGDKVVVGACAQERRAAAQGPVLGRHAGQFLLDLEF